MEQGLQRGYHQQLQVLQTGSEEQEGAETLKVKADGAKDEEKLRSQDEDSADAASKEISTTWRT